MRIKHKLSLNAAIVILMVMAMFAISSWALMTVERLGRGHELALRLEADMLKLRRDEKDFMARRDPAYVRSFDAGIDHAVDILDVLKNIASDYDIKTTELKQLEGTFLQYQQDFHRVAEATERIGLDHESGLQGALRQAVHQIEEALEQQSASDAMLVTMLQLRRAEKDFIMRGDEKYLGRFDRLLDQLKQQLRALNDSRLIELADRYQARFKGYADGRRELGLTRDQGLRLTMRETVHRTQTLLASVNDRVASQLEVRLDRAHTLGLTVFLAIMLITVLSAWLIGRSVFRPIQRIRTDIQRIHSHHDLSLRVDAGKGDEIAEMADALNQMLSGLQTVIQQVNRSVDAMNRTTDQLSDDAARTADETERQRQETEQVATSVTQMVSTIEEIAGNTERMADNARQTHEDAVQGQQQVQQAIQLIHQLADQLTESVGAVSELSEQSQSIGQVLDVIRDIAEQTNLLALNAAIEAARAGEQGRGFAVVADEVRALAARTQEATEEIGVIIRSLQERTDNIVGLINRSQSEGLESQEQAAKVGQVLEAITRDVTDISERATQVAAAVEEQSSVSGEVGQNIVVIRDITEATSEGVQRNARASEEISCQASELQQAVAVFKV